MTDAEKAKTTIEDMNLDWDSPISAEEKEFTVAPEGEYNFSVTGFERTTSSRGSKMAKLTLGIETDEGVLPIFDYLVLTTKMEWKLSQFFECIGEKEKGVPLKSMPWDKVMGAEGRAKVVIEEHEYKGEKRKSNKIGKYLPASKANKKEKATFDPDELPFEI